MIFAPKVYRKEKLAKNCSFLELKSSDGTLLEGVIYEPLNAESTMLFFSGKEHDVVGIINKLSQNYPTIRIISFNYRSYGRSQGRLTEQNILNDGIEIADIVKKNYGEFFLVGYSLGSVIASFIASKRQVNSLILLGAFNSLASLIKERFFNISYLLRYKLFTGVYLEKTNTKTYIFVSKNDEVVPIKNARELKNRVKNLVSYEELEHLSHQEILWDERVIEKISTIY